MMDALQPHPGGLPLDNPGWVARLALVSLPKVGPVTARQLLQFFEPEALFSLSLDTLMSVEGINAYAASSIYQNRNQALDKAQRVWEDLKNTEGVSLLWIGEENYPQRLSHCYDAPVLLFQRGSLSLNTTKSIGIIGTRRPTQRGLKICQELVGGLSATPMMVVSGLAFGIDACAHQAALDHGLPTVGILAHGVSSIYPAAHTQLARKMLSSGAWLTEFFPGTPAEAHNFPMRNRIVAGMSDVLLVVESDAKGGSMITAQLAESYGREIFAVPGHPKDIMSRGCNLLIKEHRARMVETAADVLEYMQWVDQSVKPAEPLTLFDQLSAEEALVVEVLKREESLSVDNLLLDTGLSRHQLMGLLLEMEIKALVRSVPGQRFALV
jgi:DNA processing protein